MDTDKIDAFLAHHGIQGQKWGVSNGPPYPLSEEKHQKVINKAKKIATSTGEVAKKVGTAAAKTTKKISENVNQRREERQAKKREEEIRNLTPKTFELNRTKYSDEEVLRISNRLRTEQQIASLSQQRISKGENFVVRSISSVASNAIKDLGTASSTVLIERLLGYKMDDIPSSIREEFSKIRKSGNSNSKSSSSSLSTAFESEIKKFINEELAKGPS